MADSSQIKMARVSADDFRTHVTDMLANDCTDMDFEQMADELWDDYMAVLEEELTCSVCLAVMVRPVRTLECTHKFCACCLLQWGADKESLTCPMCRVVVKNMMRIQSVDLVAEAIFDCHPLDEVRLGRVELREAHSSKLDAMRMLYQRDDRG